MMAAYARQAAARTAGVWSVAGEVATLVSTVSFPAVATGTATATFFGIGKSASGAGELVFFGPLSPPVVIAAGVTPQIGAGTTVTQAAGDGMADAAGTDLLKLLFNNTTWAGVGDATGIVGSGAAGSWYLSLHSSSPLEAGSQTSNEITYT
jgi:hypothetical protein